MDDTANKSKRSQNPRTNANIFEILTFSWMLELFKLGKKRDLEENDLYTTLHSHKSSKLGNELEKKWKLELIKAHKSNKNPSLLKALIHMFGTKYMLYGLLFCLDEIIFKMSQPLLIGGLLSHFNPDGPNKTSMFYSYIYASGLVCNTLISIFLYVSTQIENLQCGMKIRVACSSIIFRKALRLSHTALHETTIGHMTNLLSNDVNRFDLALSTFHYLWIGPLQMIIVTYFLWNQIGYSSIFGVATYLFFIPLQVWMGKRISDIRQKAAIKTDARLRLMNEIISGIQLIKMYTWEKPFACLVECARKLEVDHVREASHIRIILMSIRPLQIRLQLFISILSYVILGNDITIQKVFVVSSFYNLMGRTMGMLRGMDYLAEALISIKRLQNFLLLEEKNCQNLNISNLEINGRKNIGTRNDGDTEQIKIDSKNNLTSLNNVSVVISNVTAKWKKNQTTNTLDNINLTAKSGTLIAIIGSVGSGKSSLIQAILKELPLSKGIISVHGVVSYASQDPWVFTGTIQQNILFDSSMNKKRYEQVVKSCALISDFEKFLYGDKTIVGEGGINLSGGQKARINLARALYKQADIYLLDDPLSAVDIHVGKHIFENCIKDFLRQKTCIFTTHQIQYIPNVDQIVLMENAKILAEGPYQELQASVYDFSKFLKYSEEKISLSNIEETNMDNKIINQKVTPQSFNDISSSSTNKNKFKEESKKNDEIRSSGNVSNSIYLSYFSAGGSTCKIILFFMMFVLTQVLITGGDYWLNFWVKQEEDISHNEYIVSTKNNTSTIHNNFFTLLTLPNVRQYCVLIYIILIIIMIVIWLFRNALTVSICMDASTNLHNRMFHAIIRATMSFLKNNSSGRISNRFSKDIGAIDDILPKILLSYLQILMLVGGIIFVIGLINIYLMIPTLIIGLIFYYIRIYYLATSRSIKRLEGITKSPLFTHLNESIEGVYTVRAYGAEETLSKEFDKHQDLHSSAWYLFISANEAFGLWLDIVCLIYISIVTFSFVYFETNAYRGNIGLAITQIITLSGMVQWGIRQSTELENQMISVERILEYTNSPQETGFQSVHDKKLIKRWPERGQIEFKNLSLRYNQDTPYVLKNLNFKINQLEKVGIVGRTGAGKSSLITALFRLAFNEGKIFIDDIDIHEIGLYDLRSKLTIIPQEPVLFTGTIRTNLDPFGEYADHILWNALDKVELKVFVEELHDGLNSKISGDGFNFSVGQRQLVCLARAIVRNNKIIIFDEATANVDPQTDSLIQNTIRNKFRGCTILTIAHRLNSIIDSDKVIVMVEGTVAEFDHPYKLLKNKDSFFSKMVHQTGSENSDLLHVLAEENINNMEQK